MASNPTPEDDDVLCALAEDLADGCHRHETTLQIKQNTEAVIRAALAEVMAAKLAAGAAKVDLAAKHALHTAADEAGRELLLNCRLRLLSRFGRKYSAQWEAAGFPDGKTAVPETLDRRFALLGALKAHFASHPADESADMGATAAACSAAHTALSDARNALNRAKAALSLALAAAKSAAATLRRRVRGLISELGLLMPPNDPRYLDFGLNIPATPAAPLAIPALALTAIGGGMVLAVWKYAPRMRATRLETLRVGVDEDFVSRGTVAGLQNLIEDLTPGQTLKVRVTPYNAAGDGPAGPVESVVVT